MPRNAIYPHWSNKERMEETSGTITDNQVETWLKNDNKIGETKVTRYANIECYSTFEQKKHVRSFSPAKGTRWQITIPFFSAIQKLAEFKQKRYPEECYGQLSTIAVKTRNTLVQGTEDDLRNRTQAHKHTHLFSNTNTWPIVKQRRKPGGKRRVVKRDDQNIESPNL